MSYNRSAKSILGEHAFDVTPILGIPVLLDPFDFQPAIPINEARVLCRKTYHERDWRWSVIHQQAGGRVVANGFLTEKAALSWACARAAVTQVLT